MILGGAEGRGPQLKSLPLALSQSQCQKVVISEQFLPRDALLCKARYCDCMSFVCPSVCKVGGSGPHTLHSMNKVDYTANV